MIRSLLPVPRCYQSTPTERVRRYQIATTIRCRQCSGDLTHPTEIRSGLCVVCYFDNLRPAEPLPPSDYWQMDLATRDMLDSRQQTEMSGER